MLSRKDVLLVVAEVHRSLLPFRTVTYGSNSNKNVKQNIDTEHVKRMLQNDGSQRKQSCINIVLFSNRL